MDDPSEEIKVMRLRRGMTQMELAAHMEVHENTVLRWEKPGGLGLAVLRPLHVKKLAALMGVPTGELCDAIAKIEELEGETSVHS